MVQKIPLCAATENEVQVFMRNIMQIHIIKHASERCNTGSCANKEQIFFNIFRQREHSLCPPEGKFTTLRDVIEQIVSACASFQQHNQQFIYISTIGPACYRIAAPSFIFLLMYRKVKGNKLSCLEIKRFDV